MHTVILECFNIKDGWMSHRIKCLPHLFAALLPPSLNQHSVLDNLNYNLLQIRQSSIWYGGTMGRWKNRPAVLVNDYRGSLPYSNFITANLGSRQLNDIIVIWNILYLSNFQNTVRSNVGFSSLGKMDRHKKMRMQTKGNAPTVPGPRTVLLFTNYHKQSTWWIDLLTNFHSLNRRFWYRRVLLLLFS